MHRTTKMKMTDLNPHITCRICDGYFIDATTIAECLHSFCKTCIVTHLNRSKFCPICDVQVHKTKPLLNIRSDQKLQDIVYKLVPGLFQSEMNRRRQYYEEHPVYVPANKADCGQVSNQRFNSSNNDFISLSLEFHHTGIPFHQLSSVKTAGIQRRFYQCPANVTIHHLKELLRRKFNVIPVEQVDVMYTDDPLPDSYSLMDIAYIYAWRRHAPMRLYFRFHFGDSPSKKMKLSMNGPLEKVSTALTSVKREMGTDTKAQIKSEPMEVAELEVVPMEVDTVKEVTKDKEKDEGNIVQLEISESGEMKAILDSVEMLSGSGETVLSSGNADKPKQLVTSIPSSLLAQFPTKEKETSKPSLTSNKVKIDRSAQSQSVNRGTTASPLVSRPASTDSRPAAPMKPRLLSPTSPRSQTPNARVSNPSSVQHSRAAVVSSSATLSPSNISSTKTPIQSMPVVCKSGMATSTSGVPKVSLTNSPRPPVSSSKSQSPQYFTANLQIPQRETSGLQSTLHSQVLSRNASPQVTSTIASMKLDRPVSQSPTNVLMRLKGNSIPKQTHRSRMGSSKNEIPSVQMLNINRTTHLSMTKSEASTKATETSTTSSSSVSSSTSVTGTTTTNTMSTSKQGNASDKEKKSDVLMMITEKSASQNCSSPAAFPNSYYGPTDSKVKPGTNSQPEKKSSQDETEASPQPTATQPKVAVSTSSNKNSPDSNNTPQPPSKPSSPIVSKKSEIKKPPSLKPIAPHPSQVVGTTKASIISSANKAKFFKSRNQPRYLGNPSEKVRPIFSSPSQTSSSKPLDLMKVDSRTLSPVWGPHVSSSEVCKATAIPSTESLLSTTYLPESLSSCFPPYNGVGKTSLDQMSAGRHPSAQPLMPWSLMGAKASAMGLPLFPSMPPHPTFIPHQRYMPPFAATTSVPIDASRKYPTTSTSGTENKKIENLANGSVQQNA